MAQHNPVRLRSCLRPASTILAVASRAKAVSFAPTIQIGARVSDPPMTAPPSFTPASAISPSPRTNDRSPSWAPFVLNLTIPPNPQRNAKRKDQGSSNGSRGSAGGRRGGCQGGRDERRSGRGSSSGARGMSPSVQEEETTRVSECSGSASGNGIGLAPSPPVTGTDTRSSGNSGSRNGTSRDLSVTGAGAPIYICNIYRIHTV